MKKLFALLVIALALIAVPLATQVQAVEICGAGYINGKGCVAKSCQWCDNGWCYDSYEVVVFCPGDPLLPVK